MRGRTVCYHHGGTSRAGVAAAAYSTGRYSKYLPARLLGRYREASADPDLLALREEIALLDARLADLLARVDSGESGARWRQVKAAFTAWSRARGRDTEPALLDDLRVAIFAGVSDLEAWAEVHTALLERERLVASERRRLVEMQQTITATQAMTLITQLADSVRRHVHDRDAVAAISADLLRLLSVEAAGAAGD